MKLSNPKQIAVWILVIWSVFVLVQSLFFKFQGHEETQIIFRTIGEWMAGISILAWAASPFEAFGGYAVGSVELVAAVMLVIPKTRCIGAVTAILVLSGAIFFHLFTPLGVVRVINAAGDTDGGALFFMACSVWVSCLLILILGVKNHKVVEA